MPETTTIPRIRHRVAAGDRDEESNRAPHDVDILEAPLATVPYPLEPCHGACLDTRDVENEEDAVRYRSARW